MNLPLRLQVEAARGPRSSVDVQKPVYAGAELEADGSGGVVSVTTIILTAAECPWRCTMCDLWEHTLEYPTPRGAIPAQIEHALDTLRPSGGWIKLYNSGSFFDRRSIPREDYGPIAALCKNFERVVVENHPKLCNQRIVEFADLLDGQLEIAIGVETLQTGMLRRLNKGMNRDDIDDAIGLHHRYKIDTRAFVLLRPPRTGDDEAVRWTKLTLRHLFRLGVRHVSMVPVRAGNGWMNRLAERGDFVAPSVGAVERAFDSALAMVPRGVATVDLWDWPQQGKFGAGKGIPGHMSFCPSCVSERWQRLADMNLTQAYQSPIRCERCDGGR